MYEISYSIVADIQYTKEKNMYITFHAVETLLFLWRLYCLYLHGIFSVILHTLKTTQETFNRSRFQTLIFQEDYINVVKMVLTMFSQHLTPMASQLRHWPAYPTVEFM